MSGFGLGFYWHNFQKSSLGSKDLKGDNEKTYVNYKTISSSICRKHRYKEYLTYSVTDQF